MVSECLFQSARYRKRDVLILVLVEDGLGAVSKNVAEGDTPVS